MSTPPRLSAAAFASLAALVAGCAGNPPAQTAAPLRPPASAPARLESASPAPAPAPATTPAAAVPPVAAAPAAAPVAPEPPPLEPAERAALVAGQLPAGPQRELLEVKCLTCHSLDYVTQQRLPEGAWKKELEKMRKFGAPLSDEDAAALLPWLSRRWSTSLPLASAESAPLPAGSLPAPGKPAKKGK